MIIMVKSMKNQEKFSKESDFWLFIIRPVLACVNMDEILKRIRNNQKKNNNNVKKDWYKVGKALLKGERIMWNKESKVAARRVYRYYTLGKGDWNGPTSRMFAKMGREKFEEKLQT